MKLAWLSTLCTVIVINGSVDTGVAFQAAQKTPSPRFDVHLSAGRLSLRSDGAPLGEVIEAIGHRAQLKITLRGTVDTPLTEEFKDIPLDDAFRRLSRWHSIVLIYDSSARPGDPPLLREVWVTHSDLDSRNAKSEATDVQTGNIQREQRPPKPNYVVAPDLPESRLALQLRRGSPESRRHVLDALVRERGRPAVLEMLREAATRDPDPRVRRGAIQALGSFNSADALEVVRATLHDPHPGVRYEADRTLRQGQARSE
jgi:HEAT repeat protein